MKTFDVLCDIKSPFFINSIHSNFKDSHFYICIKSSCLWMKWIWELHENAFKHLCQLWKNNDRNNSFYTFWGIKMLHKKSNYTLISKQLHFSRSFWMFFTCLENFTLPPWLTNMWFVHGGGRDPVSVDHSGQIQRSLMLIRFPSSNLKGNPCVHHFILLWQDRTVWPDCGRLFKNQTELCLIHS